MKSFLKKNWNFVLVALFVLTAPWKWMPNLIISYTESCITASANEVFSDPTTIRVDLSAGSLIIPKEYVQLQKPIDPTKIQGSKTFVYSNNRSYWFYSNYTCSSHQLMTTCNTKVAVKAGRTKETFTSPANTVFLVSASSKDKNLVVWEQ